VAQEAFRLQFDRLKERDAVAEALKDPAAHANTTLLSRLSDIDHYLEESGFYERDSRTARVLSGLGFPEEQQSRSIATFSGGWQMRVALARLLLSEPDLMLLDEPTNYLDTEARAWLLSYLQKFRGGIVIVSHDRAFLDDLVQEILEIYLSRLQRFHGNYSSYEKTRITQLEQVVSMYEKQRREIERIESFVRRFRSNASKARQVQSRIRQLEKIELIEIPQHLRPIHIKIPVAPPSGRIVFSAEGLGREYDGKTVISGLDFSVKRGERIAVTGPNGAGKSTFLRICSQADTGFSGTFQTGTGVRAGYFAQDSTGALPPGQTILGYCESLAPYSALPAIRDLLGSFLFSGDDVDKPIGVLSGGEKTRLVLVTLLIQPVNLLVLDEPTNHLDMTSKDVLASALRQFDGSVLFVSHDRNFNEAVATSVLEFRPATGKKLNWTYYPGDFSYYQYQRAAAGQTDSAPRPRSEPETSDAAVRYTARKEQKSVLRRLDREEEKLVASIEKLEQKKAEIQTALSDTNLYSSENSVLIREYTVRLQQIERTEEKLHQQWVALEDERKSVSLIDESPPS